MGGQTHARELARLRGARLSAVYGRDEDKTRTFARKFGVPKTCSRYESLLEDPEIDVVNVATPNGLHRDFAIEAANAGKHVLVEKPLEITLARALEIVEACERNGVILGVIFQMRFGRSATRLKRAIDEGRLGRLLVADAIDKEYRPPEYYARDHWRGTRALEGGGCLTTQSIHVIDLLQWLGRPGGVGVREEENRPSRHRDRGLRGFDRYFSGRCAGSDRKLDRDLALHEEPGGDSRHRGGGAIINGEWDQTFFWNVGDDEKVDAPEGFAFTDIDDPRGMPEERHGLLFADINAAIREGRPPLMTGREALKSVAITEAIYTSAESGREVSVSELLSAHGIAD